MCQLRWPGALPTGEETRRDEQELGEQRWVLHLGISREEKEIIPGTALKTPDRKLYNETYFNDIRQLPQMLGLDGIY